jgi:hypothetical protein
MISKGVSTKSKQIPIHGNDSPKKLAPKDKTKPLGSQKVGLKKQTT